LLLRREFPPQELRRLLTLQRDAATTLQALISDILDLSKMEGGKVDLETVAFEMRAVVSSCELLVCHSAAAKGLTFHTAVDPAVPAWLEGDPTRLRQVMLNLLSNAIKFTDSGDIELVARVVGSAPQRLRISVKDTGIGIPADKRGRLFQPFSQIDSSTRRRFGGSGLGLAICRRLVALMGGQMGAESEEGSGSEFWFELPLVTALAPAALDPDDAASHYYGPPRRILLAEDNATIQILVSSVLETAGHQVEIVVNGEEAVDAASSGAFDIILMDINMPIMDGFVAAQRIRASQTPGRHVPIIALTANVANGSAERCRAAGMDEFVAKPINIDQLLQTIAQF
jgi:CheY-like chemotaxis protein